jgi:hypothetical protein
MSKIDEIRRQREAHHAQNTREKKPEPASTKAAKVVPIRPEVTVAPVATATGARAKRGADEEGKCAHCGKMKSLSNGLVSQHQKGLGKVCPGSRKAPA